MKYLLIMVLFVSCGKLKVETKIPDTTQTVTLDDGFRALHEFCDDKYGIKTLEADECISDGLAYKDINIGVKLELGESLIEFCNTREESTSCVEDLTDLIQDLTDQNDLED